MEWLNSNIAYWHWMVFGLLLVASEMFIPVFVMIWFGASAIAVGLVLAVVEMSVVVQLLFWLTLSVADLLLWFKFIHPKMKNRTLSGMSREQVIGQEGMVIRIGPEVEHGTLRFSIPILGSDEWQFICREPISVGDRVSVEEISGNTLVVRAQRAGA
ncbi:MAG: NfeD family protein [Zhongshania sp.]|uniref:NfeD family protein n=1 Tax=Zhongshania sp. TaxID=1971902 RepID=UPI002629140F|nr:NfeD family protein [Zhongshania sp.]MDF1691560.1 NfeD family protein [Zhongshania sp.]